MVFGYNSPDVVGLEADFQNNVFTRIEAAAGKTGGADFDSINAFGGRRRCNVLDNGTITAYYGDPGYTEDGSNGQVMVCQPKFYYKMIPLKLEPIAGGIGHHIRKARYYVSDTPRDGFRVHPWFTVGGRELPYRLASAYEGSLFDVSENSYILDDAQVGNFTASTGDKLSSIAGAKPISGATQNLNRRNCGVLAENRGPGWTQQTVQGLSATQLLMMIEYGTFNTQTAIGQGVVNKESGTVNESEPAGQTAAIGNASGTAPGTNGLVSVSYRGQENPWGNIWKLVDGINFWGDGTLRGGIPFVADHAFEENKKDGNYKSAGFTLANASGYISAFGYGGADCDWLFMASECLDNSFLPIGDYNYISANLDRYRIALFGSPWYFGANAGGFCWRMDAAVLGQYRNVSGRLEFAPLAIQGL